MNFCNCGKSWNHRIVRDGKKLWRSSSLSPLPRQGLLKQVTQENIQEGFEYLQRERDSTISLGNLFLNVKNFFFILS